MVSVARKIEPPVVDVGRPDLARNKARRKPRTAGLLEEWFRKRRIEWLWQSRDTRAAATYRWFDRKPITSKCDSQREKYFGPSTKILFSRSAVSEPLSIEGKFQMEFPGGRGREWHR